MMAFSAPPLLLATLSLLDLSIVGLAVVLLLAISYIFGREEKDTNDFFLGGRKVPGIVACLSFVATEISALTIIGFPHTAFSENWQWVQFFIGSALSRVVVAFLFIPAFYKYHCTSIYEFLGHRFGRETQYTGSIYFFVTRLLASGVRLYATCLGVMVIMGWSLHSTILLFTFVSILFIAFGGIKAVVWAGTWQAIFFVLAALALITYLLLHIHGGITEAYHIASQSGRLSMFNFRFELNNPTTFWAGTANGFFVGLTAFGTDQEMVQRLLTVETRKISQRTILSTIFTVLPVYWMYLLIGTLLFVYFQQNPALPLPSDEKEILPFFATHYLPSGLKGLILGAIIMASIDSPLSSLTSSFVSDIYRPLIRKNAGEKHYLLISRLGVVGFGMLLAGIAFLCTPVQNILWFAFQILSITGGPMLGVFLLGLLTKKKVNRINILTMLFSTAVTIPMLILIYKKQLNLGWSWLIVIGTIITFLGSYLSGLLLEKAGGSTPASQ